MTENKGRESLTLLIIKFILPLMLTGILQLLYNAADSIVVGRYEGSSSLAAVSSVSSLVNLLVNLFMGISVGTAVAVAHDFGAKDDEGVSKTVHTSMGLALVLGIIVGAIGLIFSRTFLIWMGSPEDVLPLSDAYLKIFFLGTPANMIYNFGAAILRSIGDTKHPLYFLSGSGIVNVILNLIFVIQLKMGVAGVAWATIISQYISAIAIVLFLMQCKCAIRYDIRKTRFHWEKLRKIILVGLPAGIQSSLFSISNVVIQSSVNSFGSLVMAGNGAAASIEGFAYTAMNSVTQASLTFIGQNVGAGKIEQIGRVLRRCLVVVCIIGIAFGGLSYLFGNQLLAIYLPKDPAAIPYGKLRLLIIAVPYFFCGIMDVLTGAQRGMGMSIAPMVNSLIGSCLFRVVWISTAFVAFRSLEIIYISYPISWALTSLAHYIFYRKQLKKLKRACKEHVNAKASV